MVGAALAASVADERARTASDLGRTKLAAATGIFDRTFGAEYLGFGSNAWVVSGRLTRSGSAMLAGDPHLSEQIPSLFYLARIQGDRLQAAGATLPGVPVVVFGHNSTIAWSATNLAADVQDLYLERLSQDGTSYQHNGRWQALASREETIRVAPDFPKFLRARIRPLPWRVRSTDAGPLISDALGPSEPPLALRWTGLDPDDTTFGSFLAINYSHDLASFRKALGKEVAPALAFAYADKANNIALIAAGRIPVRRSGRGELPAPGWTDEATWNRYLTSEELPSTTNPPAGFIVSANQQFYTQIYPYLVSKS